MPVQGTPWPNGAVHDTVAAILRDGAYQRSFWSSLLGRALVEIGRFIAWVYDLAHGIPGGRTIVIGIVVLVVLLVVIRLVLLGQRAEEGPRRIRAGARATRIDPWFEAQSLAESGDYLGASHALYQGVLRRLAATERIRLHSSKTAGDYSRELRRRGSPLASPFQSFGRRFERVVFGAGACTRQDFEQMLADAMAIPDRQAAA